MTPPISKALISKLANMRAKAPREVPKVRACALVVLSRVSPQSPEAAAAVANLKTVAGRNWGVGTAVQYLSGQQAEMAIACAPPDDQADLLLARLLALQVLEAAPNGQQADARLVALILAIKGQRDG